MSNIKALPFKFDIEKTKEALNFIINNYGHYFYELSWGIGDIEERDLAGRLYRVH